MSKPFVSPAARKGLAEVLVLVVGGLGFLLGSWQGMQGAEGPRTGSGALGNAEGGIRVSSPGPRFTEGGELLLPADFRRWIFAGSSLGLGYREPGAASGQEMFHTVLIQPAAYDHFVRTGGFPDGTMLALTIYERAEKVPPSERGYFEGDLVALSIALKDTDRFEERWGYFSFTGPGRTLKEKASRIPPGAGCNGCHARHGAVDNVFVQFYPNLRRER